jgi:hypothetical protein
VRIPVTGEGVEDVGVAAVSLGWAVKVGDGERVGVWLGMGVDVGLGKKVNITAGKTAVAGNANGQSLIMNTQANRRRAIINSKPNMPNPSILFWGRESGLLTVTSLGAEMGGESSSFNTG